MESETHSEKIIRDTLSGLVMYFASVMQVPEDSVKSQMQSLFPTWSHLWNVMEPWLRQQELRDQKESIVAFARTLPDFDSFHQKLENAMSIHEEFWNKVYHNLKEAKLHLSC